jgi:hypothetical protein
MDYRWPNLDNSYNCQSFLAGQVVSPFDKSYSAMLIPAIPQALAVNRRQRVARIA